jgi:RecA-family ATPase
LKELQTMTFDPITFLVPGLIPADGTTLICSKPKVGKSWLLLDIALSSTADRYILGQIKAVQGDVLYLALEDSLRRLQQRATKLLPTFTGEWPEDLTIATQWRRVDQGGLDDTRDWVTTTRQKGRRVAFIAVDVLKMVRPRPQAGKQAYDLDYEAIMGLRQLSLELSVPILIAHHTLKAEAEDLIDKVSGTLGLTAAADTIIVIERQSQGTVFDIRGRDLEAHTLAVEFNKTSCRWTILGDAATVRHSAERQQVLEIFREANTPLKPKSVTERLDEVSHSAGEVSHFSLQRRSRAGVKQ